jgi:hypothetical protein
MDLGQVGYGFAAGCEAEALPPPPEHKIEQGFALNTGSALLEVESEKRGRSPKP